MSYVVEALPIGTRHIDSCQVPRDSIPAWHCLATKPKRESDADKAMLLSGFETFFPRYQMVWRDRQRCIRPLFIGYTFARFDAALDPWTFVVKDHYDREVATVMCDRTTRKPFIMPDRVVDLLRSQMADDGVIYPAKKRQLEKGDLGKVEGGPFASFTGVCQRTHKERIWMLLNILGHQREVEFRRDAVELVA
jgi:transcription antitermination factor NusG